MRALLMFMVFFGFMLGARWFYVCQVKGLCEGGSPAEDIRLQTLSLRDGDRILLENYDQFVFDTTSVDPRLNSNNEIFLDSVALLMRALPNKNLSITGRFRPAERGLRHGFFENLGVARADEARKELMKRGIDENRITLDYGQWPEDHLSEPLVFELYTPGERGLVGYERAFFTFTNMTFSQANFAFDSDEFRPGEAFILYADSVRTFLEINPEMRLRIIGHTDNIDTEAYNYDLGLRRAQSARQYLRELGVVSEIEVESMGETQPVASNETAEGRSKNRRVNFVLVSGR